MFKVYRPLIVAVVFCMAIQQKSQAQSADPVKKAVPPYQASIDSLKRTYDPLKQEAIITRLEKAYPKDDFHPYKYALVYHFAAAKNIDKALTYFKQLRGGSREAALVSLPMLMMKVDVKAAEAFVEHELEKPDNSPEERRVLLNQQMLFMIKKDDYKKAFIAMKEYYNLTVGKTPGLSVYYYYLMSKSGSHKEAFPELEKAAANGMASEDVKKELKATYAKLNPGKDPVAYLAALVKPIEDQYKAKVLKKLVSKEAPNFMVTDVNGKAVSLSDFKGKIVVLDFWATWCGPCKSALPAMQMTVDKYQDDPNVKFLFIHTWEKVDNPKEDAMNYLADNNFRLPLYMDLGDPRTFKNPAVSAFGVAGIPAKFVIDGQGNIRFMATGFSGASESAFNELSAMIEVIRSAKTI